MTDYDACLQLAYLKSLKIYASSELAAYFISLFFDLFLLMLLRKFSSSKQTRGSKISMLMLYNEKEAEMKISNSVNQMVA